VLVLRLLPSAVGAPVAARVVSRWRRREVMMTADLVRAAMAVALPVLSWLGWVYFWAFAIEVVSLSFLPARDAAIPMLIGDTEGEDHDAGTLAVANGVTMGTSYGMIPFGAGAFGLILWLADSAGWGGHWRYVLVFWLDALSYLASYLAIRSISDLGPRASDERPKQERTEGFLQALRIPVVRGILPGVAVVGLGLGALFSLGVVFVRSVIRAGPVGFGVLVMLFGVGATLGLSLLRRRAGRGMVARVRLAAMVQGIVITAMGLIASAFWSYVGAVLFGAAATGALVGAITFLQESLTGTSRNLALTAFHAVLRGCLALSALISGAAADLVGTVGLGPFGSLAPSQTVLAASGLVVLAGTPLIRRVRPDERPKRQNPSEIQV
jgi:dTMP kinase